MKRIRSKPLAFILLLSLLLGMVFSSGTLAFAEDTPGTSEKGIIPVYKDGNDKVKDYPFFKSYSQWKTNDPHTGTYSLNDDNDITITVANDSVSWIAKDNIVVAFVVVKGGNGFNLYDYTSTSGIKNDSNLISPYNNGGNQAEISHISVYYIKIGCRPEYGMTLNKEVMPLSAQVGSNVTYKLTITNTGNVELTDILVKDPLFDKPDDVWQSTILSLDSGESETINVTYTIKEGDFIGELKQLINTAEAAASGAAIVTASAVVKEETTTPAVTYAITLDKSVSPAAARAGETVTYTFQVKNTGNTDLRRVTVADPMFPGDGVWEEMIGALTAGAVSTFTKTYTIPEGTQFPITNTAIATGYYGEGDGDYINTTDSAIVEYRTPIDDGGGGGGGGSTRGSSTTTTIPNDPVPEGPAAVDTVILDEPVIPEGPALPKTGEVAPMLFYGAGALIAALGARLRKR